MAKKKAKKKTKKKTKKTVRRKVVRKVEPVAEMRARLFQKLLHVCNQITGFEAMRSESEGGEGVQFGYTRASDVFEQYGRAFREAGLHWRQSRIVEMKVTHRQVFISAEYEITDVETGYSIQTAAVGQGNNGVWATNSAQTVALKQMLLEAGMVYWEEAEDEGRDNVDPWALQSIPEMPEKLIAHIEDFFGSYNVAKRKQNAKTKASQQQRSAANRQRQNR